MRLIKLTNLLSPTNDREIFIAASAIVAVEIIDDETTRIHVAGGFFDVAEFAVSVIGAMNGTVEMTK